MRELSVITYPHLRILPITSADNPRNDTIKLFADTDLFIFGDNIMNVQNEAVHSINELNNWFICNKLSLNLSKTCYMTFLLILLLIVIL